MECRTADLSHAATAEGFMPELGDSHDLPKRHTLQNVSNTALKAAAGLWFVVAVIGQLAFALYVVIFYGRAVVRWDLPAWRHGYVAGDTIGNIAFAIHLSLAVVIIVGGAIQLIPQIRKRAPALHRWNGRIYILTAFTLPVGGLYMVWVRGTVGDFSQHLATSINGVLIMLCAAMALRYALARKFAVHRRWALRLFLVSSGVWFVRLMIYLWVFLNNGPAGFNPETLSGPFLTIVHFGQFLLPLGVLELYLRARDRAGAPGRIAMALVLFALTVVMGAGIVVVTAQRWLPRIF